MEREKQQTTNNKQQIFIMAKKIKSFEDIDNSAFTDVPLASVAKEFSSEEKPKKAPSAKKADRRKKIVKSVEVDNSSEASSEATEDNVEPVAKPVGKREIHIPNNMYAMKNTKLMLRPSQDGLSYSFRVGDEDFLLSMNFNFVKNIRKTEDGSYLFYLNEKTFRNGKFVHINGRWVLVPDRNFSTTFLDVVGPYKGQCEVVSVEPVSDDCEIILVRDYKLLNKTFNKFHKKLINHSTSEGKVISHTGPVYVTFERTGRSIEDQQTFTVLVDRNGFSKVL